MGWLRRLLNVPPSVRELAQRVDLLEDDVVHLNERISKLRGRSTGGIRHQEPAGETIEAPGDIPMPPGMGVSPATWGRLSPADRQKLLDRRHRAVPNG